MFEEIRLIAIEEGINRERRVALQRRIIANLNEFSLNGIDLRLPGRQSQTAHHCHDDETSPEMHELDFRTPIFGERQVV